MGFISFAEMLFEGFPFIHSIPKARVGSLAETPVKVKVESVAVLV